MQVSRAAALAAAKRRTRIRPAWGASMPMNSLIRMIGRRAPFLAAAIFLLASAGASATDASQAFWQNAQATPLPAGAPDVSVYRPLRLDFSKIDAHLAAARHNATAVTLAIPHPDGTFSDFLLVDSRTMPDALQDRFPGIVSLAGNDGEGRKARVDVSRLGFQAMVFDRDGVWIVRPEVYGTGDRYLSFRRADLALPGQAFQCGVKGDALDASGKSLLSQPAPMTVTGATERVYRAAVAANHQYVAAVGGGTLEGGLAAVVTAMNRVNQVYETEVGVHMELIPNEDLIIYASAAGDPYSNDGNALNQNQSNLDSVIGSANYDIGHVFTTGSGGVAGLRVTCVNGQKARGTTGLSNPTGDSFYIDYVAHEMGHQFGGNHTFNSTSGACGGGNRAGSAAYEPGSGSTIMAYAGICGADNLQAHSDPYFHSKSLEEINNWIEGNGGSCTVDTPSDDAPPVIDTASLPPEVTIPMHTAFAMTGSATDPDGDSLTYNWEQYDLGPATTLAQADTGAGPIFRSFNATTSGTRVFPKIENVLNPAAPLVKGEAWPTTTRNLAFRLTVRDNHDIPGTPQYGATVSANNILIHVTNAAGPFNVTRPNAEDPALTWGRGEAHLVTWDVAGTDAPPVGCANVAIDLSDDGGATFAYPLAASTANNGTASIVVPSVPDTNQARVRVRCADSVFFDASDKNFNIAATGDPDGIATIAPPGFAFTLDPDATASDTLTIGNVGDAGTTLNFTIAEAAGDSDCASPSDVPWLGASPASGAIGGGTSAPVTVSVDAAVVGPGSYTARLCVGTDDALNPMFAIPVSLTVNAPIDEIFADGFDDGTLPAPPVQDPSFEATTSDGGSNPFWDGSDTNPGAEPGGTSFYSASNNGIPVRTGDWAIWFGGWGDGAEVQSASQNVTIASPGPRFVNYWRNMTDVPDAAGTLTLSVDGTALQTTDISTLPADADYMSQSVDVSAYADGAQHVLEIRYDYADAGGSGGDGNVFIDDVTIDASAAPPMLRPAPRERGARYSKRDR
jgi:hypothetical protein